MYLQNRKHLSVTSFSDVSLPDVAGEHTLYPSPTAVLVAGSYSAEYAHLPGKEYSVS